MVAWISGFLCGAAAMYWLWILLHPDRVRILSDFRKFANNGFRK